MKELFASSSAGIIGLLFFFIFFCFVALWTFRPGAKPLYKKHGDIPLKEDDQ